MSAVYFNPRATVSKLFADPQREGHPNERVFAEWYMVADGRLHMQEAHPSNYRETMADGGYLMLNAHAARPIDSEPFFKQGVTICSFDADRRVLTSRTPTPFLKTRITCGVIPDDFPPKLMVNGQPAHSTETAGFAAFSLPRSGGAPATKATPHASKIHHPPPRAQRPPAFQWHGRPARAPPTSRDRKGAG